MNNFHSVEGINPTVQPTNPIFTQNSYSEGRSSKKLKVVTFNYLPSAYKFVSDWISENGHEHILAVVSPGIKTRATPAYRDLLPLIPSHVDTLTTSKIKSVLTPMLHQLKPDIILCFTFAHLLDTELCKIPTYGIVNIHPSVLPLYRGTNPMRQFYEGAKVFGATAHRIADGYDTGEILSQEYEEMPNLVTQNTAFRWGQLIKKTIANGMEKAISGKAGIVQDHSQATYAAPFTEEEKWIHFTESTSVVLRKTLALNLTGGLAKAVINGQVYKIHSAHYMPCFNCLPAGQVIKQGRSRFEIATADGSVKLITEPFDPTKKYDNPLPCSAFFEQPSSHGHTHSPMFSRARAVG
jgi:methionyl-tRNA formyltransferase